MGCKKCGGYTKIARDWKPNLGEDNKPDRHFMQGHQTDMYMSKEMHVSCELI